MKLTSRERRNRQFTLEVIDAAFQAISAAMGWDRKYPVVELYAAVKARLDGARTEVISSADDALAAKLNTEMEEHV